MAAMPIPSPPVQLAHPRSKPARQRYIALDGMELIMPSFMSIVGASLPFTLAR